MSSTKFLDRTEAAEYIRAKGLPSTPATLRKLACVGGGPAFRRFGRAVRYEQAALDEWIADRLTRPLRNTSELPNAKTGSR